MWTRRIGLIWFIAITLVACNSEANPAPIAYAPTIESASATSTSILPSLTVATNPGTSTIAATQTVIATPSASVAPSTPVPTASLVRLVPTPSPSSTATPTPDLRRGFAAPAPTGSKPCNCPMGGAMNGPAVLENYRLVEYTCVKNYVMTDWWPSQLFDSDETYNQIEGSDATALVYVSADTSVSDNSMTCRITQAWRYQPITINGVTTLPKPTAYVTPVGEFFQVLGLPSVQYRDGHTVKQHLGSATDAEQAVWMSKISDEGFVLPNPLIHGKNVVQRRDTLQIYMMQDILLGPSAIWQARYSLTGQYTSKDYLGTIEHFELAQPCQSQTCRKNGLMLWTPNGTESYIDVLYDDGIWDRFDSKLGWITYSCLGKNNNQAICAVKSDGTVETLLTNNPKNDFSPRWSPDGSRITFVSDRDGNQEIYLLGANGVTRLTNATGNDTAPAWSPDGTRIAFVSRRDGNAKVYTMQADGSTQRPLGATFTMTNSDNPSWSPDGQRIAFDSESGGQHHIYIANPNGTVTRLTNGSNDYMPIWSPDGKRIVFTARREIYEELYIINADGTGETRLATNNYPDHYPVWSPDGKSIAFCIYLPNVASDTLYVMDVATKKFTQLGDGVKGCPYSWH